MKIMEISNGKKLLEKGVISLTSGSQIVLYTFEQYDEKEIVEQIALLDKNGMLHKEIELSLIYDEHIVRVKKLTTLNSKSQEDYQEIIDNYEGLSFQTIFIEGKKNNRLLMNKRNQFKNLKIDKNKKDLFRIKENIKGNESDTTLYDDLSRQECKDFLFFMNKLDVLEEFEFVTKKGYQLKRKNFNSLEGNLNKPYQLVEAFRRAFYVFVQSKHGTSRVQLKMSDEESENLLHQVLTRGMLVADLVHYIDMLGNEVTIKVFPFTQLEIKGYVTQDSNKTVVLEVNRYTPPNKQS